MGLYPIDCPQCKKPFQWFSGGNNPAQLCDECYKPAPREPEVTAQAAEGVREWWIVREPVFDEHTLHLTKPSWGSIAFGRERIHVIEKREFDAVVRERDSYQKVALEYIAENDKVRAERGSLAVKLHEANMSLPLTNTGWPHEKKLHEKIERLEKELAACRDAVNEENIKLRFKCEDLQRELAEANQLVLSRERWVERKIEECEKLEKDNLLALDIAGKFADERDRYQNALERIADQGPYNTPHYSDIAREALSGLNTDLKGNKP